MIHLHTLGDTLIKVGEKDVRPSSPLLFGALLYLAMERGRRVPRAALQGLLFPEADERSGAHSLRQLLYKLRQLGVPLDSDASAVTMPSNVVVDHALATNGNGTHAESDATFLPYYEPRFSESYRAWFEDTRSSVARQLRSRLVTELRSAREAADVERADRVASRLLAIDPLNEEATVARAECLVMSGQKRGALQLLEEYSNEVGPKYGDRLATEVLRKRISSLTHTERETIPLIGRQSELTWLKAQFTHACSRAPVVSVIWAEAGVGKTRLVREYAIYARLQGALVIVVQSQAHDLERPLGAFLDCVPQLLQARGALGVSPESLALLNRFSGEPSNRSVRNENPELISVKIKQAVEELFEALAAEKPIVLVVEDAHWLDTPSSQLLFSFPSQSLRMQIVLTYRGQPRFPQGQRVMESVFVRHLAPLCDKSSRELLNRSFGEKAVFDEAVLDQCVALARGNPLFLCTIAAHLRLQGSAPSARATLMDMLRNRVRLLEQVPLLLLRFTAALGTDGFLDRLAACAGTSLEGTLLGLQDLADRGLIVLSEGAITCGHELLASVVLEEVPPVMKVAIYHQIAVLLERDGIANRGANLLWSCAKAWDIAQKPDRACAALRRCADLALELGQPGFAFSALEKAQDYASGQEQEAIVEQSVLVADLACDYEAILRNAKRCSALLSMKGAQPPSDICVAELNALRRTGIPIWSRRIELERFARDASASRSTRLRALRLFLISANLALDRTQAVKLFNDLQGIPYRDIAFPAVRDVHLFYHMYFGDLDKARDEAILLLESVRKEPAVHQAGLLGSIASALFHSGEEELALSVLRENIRVEQALGLDANLAMDCARMVDFLFLAGRAEEAEQWIAKNDLVCRRTLSGYSSFHLANRIWLALRNGNCDAAIDALRRLEVLPEAQLPGLKRNVLGFELLIASIGGQTPRSVPSLERLAQLDDLGRNFCDHDTFASGFFLWLSAHGCEAEAEERMRIYVLHARRERTDLGRYLNGFAPAELNNSRLKNLVARLQGEAPMANT